MTRKLLLTGLLIALVGLTAACKRGPNPVERRVPVMAPLVTPPSLDLPQPTPGGVNRAGPVAPV